MSKVQFQGYAIGKGFSNIDPGYSALSRLQEKQNQDLANLKQAEKDRRNRDIQAEADLERVMGAEEANRKEIYIEDKVLSTREKALQNNRDQAVQNNNAELRKIEQQGKDLQQIIGFSKQAFKDYQTIQKKNWDATASDSYNYYMTHGNTLEDQIRQDLAEDELFQQGANFEAIADQMRKEGYTPSEVNYVRGKNSASDYGRLKAYSIQAGLGWESFAKSEIARMGITDRAEQEAAIDALRIKYLQGHKLYGISSDFLEPMFQRMRGGTERILARTDLRESVQFTQRRSAESLEVLGSSYNHEKIEHAVDALNNYYLAKTREQKANGDEFTPAEAKQAVFDKLQDLDIFPDDAAVMKLLKEGKLLNMNKSWGDANPGFVRDLFEQRRIKRETRAKNAEAFAKAKKEEILVDKRAFFKDPTRWNGDRRVARKLLDEMKSQGFTNEELDEFKPYLVDSVQGRADGDQWRKIINDLADNGTLTTKDLESPYVPQDLKNKYWKEATENDALYGTVEFKDVKKDLGGALRGVLKEFDLETSLHYSHSKALRHAEILFRKEYKRNGGDYDAAMQKIEQQIQSGRGKFRVVNAGEQNRGEKQSFFAEFTPGSHRGAPKILNTSNYRERDKIMVKLQDDPTKLDKELLIHPEKLKEIAEQIKAGKSYRLPHVLFDISQGNPDVFGSPTDLWQRQLAVAVKQGHLEKIDLKVEDFRKTLFRNVEDPEAKKLINSIRTKGELLKRSLSILHPEYNRNPKYMSNTVVRKLQVPSVLEATLLTREQKRDDIFFEYDVNPDPFATGQYYEYGVE
tara:strand:+ start:956 stop:3358 length:2403 start_codon:yes stop_codon:yes gene_type:complete